MAFKRFHNLHYAKHFNYLNPYNLGFIMLKMYVSAGKITRQVILSGLLLTK